MGEKDEASNRKSASEGTLDFLDVVLQLGSTANHHHFHRAMPKSGLFVPIVGQEGESHFWKGTKYEIIAIFRPNGKYNDEFIPPKFV